MGVLFSGWYTERRWIEAVERWNFLLGWNRDCYDSRYRDSVTVDPVESKVIRQVNYAIRWDPCFLYLSWRENEQYFTSIQFYPPTSQEIWQDTAGKFFHWAVKCGWWMQVKQYSPHIFVKYTKNAGFSWASAPGVLEGRLPMPLVIIGFTYGESPSFKVLGSMLRLGLSGPTSPATISPVGNVNKEKSWRRRRSRLKLIASRLHWVTWGQGWLPCQRTSWQKLGTPAVGGLLSDLCWPRPILLLPSSFFLFSSLLLSPHWLLEGSKLPIGPSKPSMSWPSWLTEAHHSPSVPSTCWARLLVAFMSCWRWFGEM